jgi:L,D-transpeptidase ErfK/SrfK
MNRFTKMAVIGILSSAPMVAERRLVVSIPERKMALVIDGEVKKTFDVAVGKPTTPSPVGKFAIVTRVPNPTWYGPKKVVAPGKDNPLGTRWLGLSQKGYGVHGTSAPKSIGKAASHGCIRMRNADVEELFELVQAGDVVEISGD